MGLAPNMIDDSKDSPRKSITPSAKSSGSIVILFSSTSPDAGSAIGTDKVESIA